jgi:hypothetical protein
MQRYIVINRSACNIELVIPAPHGSNRDSACIVISPSNSFDILPLSGSIENCRRLSHLADLKYRGFIDISEEL